MRCAPPPKISCLRKCPPLVLACVAWPMLPGLVSRRWWSGVSRALAMPFSSAVTCPCLRQRGFPLNCAAASLCSPSSATGLAWVSVLCWRPTAPTPRPASPCLSAEPSPSVRERLVHLALGAALHASTQCSSSSSPGGDSARGLSVGLGLGRQPGKQGDVSP